MNESILDNPREELDGAVWKKSADGIYILTDIAKEKINKLVNWAAEFLGLSQGEFEARMVGSITSNQYSDTSDIDIHIYSSRIDIDDSDEINAKIRDAFKNQYAVENDIMIGQHPLEIYVQVNRFQDYMSVGCYDILNERWLVGPEIKPMEFDSYSEYYSDDMNHVKDVIVDIRNIILECLESAIVINKSDNEQFKEFEYQHLLKKLKEGADIFTMARNFRKVYSSPSSVEDALKKRNSEKWKIADSAFKLMDQFGYLNILRTFKECNEKQKNGELSQSEIVSTILSNISDNLSKNKNLSEEEECCFAEVMNEGLASSFGSVGIIASMLFLPSIFDQQALADGLKNVPKEEFNIHSDSVKKVIQKASLNKKVYNGLSYVNLVNLIATIIYNEAMIDYVRYNDIRCLIAIGNTIENRADKDPNKFAEVVTKPNQYYSAKHILGGIKDSNFITYFPKNGNKRAWMYSQLIAKRMINGNCPNVIGNRNMIGNEKLDNKEDWEKWGKKGDLKIGSHTFSYDKSQDGLRNIKKSVAKKTINTKPNQYTVKKGDTIGKIAKTYNKTVDQIKKLNPNIKDINKISINQKINV